MTVLAFLLAAFILAPSPANAGGRAELLTLPHHAKARSVAMAPMGMVIVTDNKGRTHRLSWHDNHAQFDAYTPEPKAQRPDMLNDGVVVFSTQNQDAPLVAAWLTAPTERYGHGVIGDSIEAGGLAVERTDGSTLHLTLPDSSVFEDRYPRLADTNGDGHLEMVLVRSYQDKGAATAIAAIDGQRLRIVAEAPAIGRANRWLNPVGIDDFDGDGVVEIAVVVTPHIGGTLTLYEHRGATLVEDHAAPNFSNHAIGDRELGKSAIADINGDKIPDIIVGDGSRRYLRFVTFSDGKFRQLGQHPTPQGVKTAIIATDIDKDGTSEIIWGDNKGRLHVLFF